MNTINIKEKFSEFSKVWYPHQIATIDDMQVVLVKINGEVDTWFKHREEDKLLQVVKGTLEIHYKTKKDIVNKGEMIIIPKGTEYTPKTKEEVHLLVFEKETLLH